MTTFFYCYITAWATACLVAAGLLISKRDTIVLLRREYRDFLLVRWKLVTFLLALAAFVVLAPYSGDTTWDYYDAAFMSILTFITAPWAVGTFYRFIRGREKAAIAYIAACAWLFSASWSYDLYLLLRDGYYPATWSGNLLASSVLYVSAGLFWNLEYREDRGVILGFMEPAWPATEPGSRFSRLLLYALPFMLIAAAVFIPFFLA